MNNDQTWAFERCMHLESFHCKEPKIVIQVENLLQNKYLLFQLFKDPTFKSIKITLISFYY